jgi:uncharacterized damage-inducible protein DinB
MGLVTNVRRKHITLMQRTLDTLGSVIQYITPEQASELTDGPDGWSVLEVLCHLRDFDEIFFRRARRILNEDYPSLAHYDHGALAEERRYREQDLTQVYVDLVKSRREFVEFFLDLTPEQWDRAGRHPEYGHYTLTDAVMQVGHHDANHIEQITRILSQTNVIRA